MTSRPETRTPLPPATAAASPSGGGRRPYAAPRLDVLGDVRDLTLAGRSPGVGDSAFPNTRP